MPILLCFSDVFLHLKDVFISHIWKVINCTAWVKPMVWSRSETAWDFIKTLWRKTVETQQTQRSFNVHKMSIWSCLTLVNVHFYDNVLGVCWNLSKIPSHTLITLLCPDSIYFILTYLLSMLATVTLLINNFYWKVSGIPMPSKINSLKRRFLHCKT